MKWNFLYQITAASRTPDWGATAPRSPFSLSSTEFVETPEQNSGYATGSSTQEGLFDYIFMYYRLTSVYITGSVAMDKDWFCTITFYTCTGTNVLLKWLANKPR